MSSDATPDRAEAVASAVLAVPGVNALYAGVFGEVATYLPGRRVNGVRLSDEACEVHVVLDWGTPVLQTADAVRVAVEHLVGGPVDVTVQDIARPDSGS